MKKIHEKLVVLFYFVYFVLQSTFKKLKQMKKERVILIFSIVVLVLAIQLVAMQITNEVNWDLPDFILMGLLLFGTGITCDLVIRKIKNSKLRIITCVILLVVLLLIWTELAVGIFGTPFAGS